MIRPLPVGIDLGTTNSAVARVDESGRSAMVPNAEGDLLTPSIVLFGDAEVVVGKEARSAAAVDPDRVALWVKRDMGSPVYSRPIRGQHLPPEVIQACVLRKLKADLACVLGKLAQGPDCEVVITVPAYFDEPRRKATADAGEMAGLSVLDIVNEPTAAALSFAETLGFLSPDGTPQQELTVLVYDLGGGTFDATLLRLSPANIRTIATDGDVQLGGHDWDRRLVDHLAEAFMKTHTHHVDPRDDPAGLNRLFGAAVEAKHTLSARSRASVRVEHAGKAIDVQITRQQFEELTADLLERTAYTTRELMTAARMPPTDLSRVLLVGGSTRMPMVTEMIRQLTGKVPDHTVNPDEAVARGAALYAAFLLAKQTEGGPPPAFEVTNVNAHSLGVEGIDPETLRKTNVVLIPRNTPLPANATEQFVTKSEGQRSIVVRVLEGESSLPGECTAIGRTVVRDLPEGLAKAWPVEVTFEYGTNGRLSVRAVVQGTQHQATLQLERAVGLTDERIARWKQPVDAAAGFGGFESAAEHVAAAPSAASPSAASPAANRPAAGVPTAGGQEASWASAPSAIPSQPAAPSGGPTFARPAASAGRARSPTKSTVPRWAVNLVGYVVSTLLAMGVAYLVLHYLHPVEYPWPWE